MSPIRPQPCAAVETGTSCGACRLWFAGRGLRAQARVKTARLRSRPTWGPGFAATAVRQAPLAGETHCCEQGRRGRFQVYRSVSPRSERSYCLSAPWVSANEGLFLRPPRTELFSSLCVRVPLPTAVALCARPTRACPECSPANRTTCAGTALLASLSRHTALPPSRKRRNVAGPATYSRPAA